MDLAELTYELRRVQTNLDWIRKLRMELLVEDQLTKLLNYCTKCGKKYLVLWGIRRLETALILHPWAYFEKRFVHTHILDGQCFNPDCGHSVWPFVLRLNPECLKVAPPDAQIKIGEDLFCRHCKQHTVNGVERDGRITVGQCQACRHITIHGEAANERWRFILKLVRRQHRLLWAKNHLIAKIAQETLRLTQPKK